MREFVFWKCDRDRVRWKMMRDEGLNELPKEKSRSGWKIMIEILREPMLTLLVLSVVLYFFLGEVAETILLAFSVALIIFISYYQERRTERALEALKSLVVPIVVVIRNGVKIKIERKNVVVGDKLWIKEGERVGADGRILEESNLMVDESMLTGESLAIEKKTDESVFMGTMVVRGEAIVEVTAIGVKTEMGKIGKSLEAIEMEETDLQKQTKQAVRFIGFWSLVVCLLLVVYFGLLKNKWIEGVLAGLTTGMALLPEEFPVVMTVFLALGAWRISKKKVLTRKMAAIETLGSITTLCVDKTGTLTENKMSVEQIADKKGIEKTDRLYLKRWANLLRVGMMASSDDPFEPLEIAIKNLFEKQKLKLRQDVKLERKYALGRKFTVARGWKEKNGKYFVALKGSPEGVVDKCVLSVKDKKTIIDQVEKMAGEGMRVIGVAEARNIKVLPKKKSDIKYQWIGLFGIKDPLRRGVKEALNTCGEAGIKVIMITGDYPATARRIAMDAGMVVEKQNMLIGEEIEKMSREQLRERIFETKVCARIKPEQKLLIIEALKGNSEVVGMTGDGVNDAPALKIADVGVAMGKRGTDVAREASDLVLLNDDFESLVTTVAMGRRIYRNIKKAMMYLISVHIPIAGISLLPVLFNEQILLLPIHVVLMELIIDPMASIVFELRNEKGLMKIKPRKKETPLFDRHEVWRGMGRGLLMLSVSLMVFVLIRGKNEDLVRGWMFVSLVVGNLLLAVWYLGEKEDVDIMDLAGSLKPRKNKNVDSVKAREYLEKHYSKI